MRAPPPVERVGAGEFVERAYLDYSMTVVLDRALPAVSDGLKPVQRRILYAMSELGLAARARPKKSARTVGDVIGKFHPHGDAACYEAMVWLAQPFTCRYPLIEGQGNWGSPDDPKSFAAMRYTESRLTPYAGALIDELGSGVADWRDNFDGTLREPTILPARLPNLLLNGASGIAVGMSTDIPPHNLGETVAACVALLKNSRLELDSLLAHIRGPDFPGGGEIVSSAADIREIYATGTGSLRVRAKYRVEKEGIIIEALPYQAPARRVIEQIVAESVRKKLNLIKDIRDESDEEHPVRIVIKPRARVQPDELMSHLFARTDLEKSCRVNLNVIDLKGRPGVKPLKALLLEWLEFRRAAVRRRLEWRRARIEERLEALAGLLIAHLHIERVIEIIRNADEPRADLMREFKLSAAQADAILDLRLKRLAKLERIKLERERAELEKELAGIVQLLGSEARIKTLIKKELLADAAAHGDERRTRLVEKPRAAALAAPASSDPATVVLSVKGWARALKGRELDLAELEYHAGDAFRDAVETRTDQLVTFLDAAGRAYSLPVGELSARAEPLSSRFELPPETRFVAALGGDEALCLLASSAGRGFLATPAQLASRLKVGKQIMHLDAGAELVGAVRVADPAADLLVALSDAGRMLVVPADAMPARAKGKGQKLIQLPRRAGAEAESLLAIACVGPAQTLCMFAGQRSIKRMSYAELQERAGARGRRGRPLPKHLIKADRLAVE